VARIADRSTVLLSTMPPYRLTSTLAPLVFLLGSLIEFGKPACVPVFFCDASQLAHNPKVLADDDREFIDEVCLNPALHLRYRCTFAPPYSSLF